MPSPGYRSLVPIALALALVLPSHAVAQREKLLLSSRPPPKGQSCAISEREPPALDAMVDSVGLHADLVALWNSDEAERGYALLSLAIDSTGTFARPPGLIETDLPDLTAAMVAAFVGERESAERIDDYLYARVKVTLDSVPHFELGRSETCRPELANRQEVSRYLNAAARQTRQSGTVALWLFVTGNGRVTEMKIQQSSGDDTVDRLALAVGQHMRFHPARVDYGAA